MKYLSNFFLLLLFLSPLIVVGQIADSLSRIADLDTLSAKVKIQFENFQFESALKNVADLKSNASNNFGKTHPKYIDACLLEANIYWRKGDYENAINSSNEGIAVQLLEYGKNNVTYSGLLHIRGTILLEMAKYQEAEQDLKECLTIREQVSGKENAKYAMTLNNLANLYNSTGDFDKSLNLHQEAKDIRQRVMGEKSMDYAMSLANLGRTSFQTAQYEKSIVYLNKAKSIVEAIYGKQHPINSFAAHNSAIAYLQMGQYEKAESTFLEALQLTEKNQGKEHPSYSFILNDLGGFYDNLGMTDKAVKVFEQSLAIKEKILGREHNYTLVTLANLAKIYQEQGELLKAEGLYKEVANSYAKLYGKEHFENLMVLNNLANIYTEQNELEKADSLHRDVLSLRQNILGADHPDCGMSMMGMAQILEAKGDLKAAISMFENASVIFNRALGKTNLNSVKCYQDLAEAHWKIKNSDLTIAYIDSLDAAMQAHFTSSAKYLSSDELQLMLSAAASRLDFILTARLKLVPKAPQIVAATYNHALLYKGMLLENAIELEKSMTHSPDSVYQQYLEWKALQRRLAQNYTLPASDRKTLAELEQRAERLEKDLLKHNSFKSINEDIDWKKIQESLKPGEVAIEFLHFRGYDPEPTDSVYYTAVLIRPEWDLPRWIKLFNEKDLLPFFSDSAQRKSDYAENLFAEFNDRPLYDLIWKPIEPYLKGVDRVIYAPSGILHRIPLAAIQNDKKEILNDRYALQLVGSTRQLLKQQGQAEFSGLEANVFGGVRYDMDSTAMLSSPDLKTTDLAIYNNFPDEASRAFSSENASWKYLVWTEVEAKTLDLLFQKNRIPVTLHTGYGATEEAVKTVASKDSLSKILHLATHGYFFPDPAIAPKDAFEPAFKISEHPMIRSGMILAGANHVWTGGKPLENMEDGILTAYEVSQMDLSNTELVVLSACETGLGDIKGNEGVYGLQRAFKIAGARYVLMSLWQVPDYATHELMTAFYTNWLEKKMSIPEAFRASQQEIRKKRPEAYFWAGFVLVE